MGADVRSAAVERRHEQVLLGREVEVAGSLGDARSGADLVDRDVVEAAGGELLEGGGDESVTGAS